MISRSCLEPIAVHGSILEMCQTKSLRVDQSMMVTGYRFPRRIGRQVMLDHQGWPGRSTQSAEGRAQDRSARRQESGGGSGCDDGSVALHGLQRDLSLEACGTDVTEQLLFLSDFRGTGPTRRASCRRAKPPARATDDRPAGPPADALSDRRQATNTAGSGWYHAIPQSTGLGRIWRRCPKFDTNDCQIRRGEVRMTQN